MLKLKTACGALMLLATLNAGAQSIQSPPPPGAGGQFSSQFSTEQLDQMLAPIALYPDTLLAQILMAATYPLEIVEADRWLQDPNNAALHGDDLGNALQQQPWDPSIKSLIPFPQILHMLDNNLTWTEQLGDAFLAGQDAVMDSVQRLRRKAQLAGTLQSSPQETVSTQGGYISVQPPNDYNVYVPVYDPDTAYGAWAYPEYPPYYLPLAAFGGVAIGGWFGCVINVPLWGWGRWDWGHHRVYIDGNRFNAINAHRFPVTSGVWQHDPAHRGGVPYRNEAVSARFAGASRTAEARRSYRGYPPVVTPQVTPQVAPQVARPVAAQAARQTTYSVQAASRVSSPYTTQNYRAPTPVFESFGRGADIRPQAIRGRESRQSLAQPEARNVGNAAAVESRPQAAPAARGGVSGGRAR